MRSIPTDSVIACTLASVCKIQQSVPNFLCKESRQLHQFHLHDLDVLNFLSEVAAHRTENNGPNETDDSARTSL